MKTLIVLVLVCQLAFAAPKGRVKRGDDSLDPLSDVVSITLKFIIKNFVRISSGSRLRASCASGWWRYAPFTLAKHGLNFMEWIFFYIILLWWGKKKKLILKCRGSYVNSTTTSQLVNLSRLNLLITVGNNPTALTMRMLKRGFFSTFFLFFNDHWASIVCASCCVALKGKHQHIMHTHTSKWIAKLFVYQTWNRPRTATTSPDR